MLVSISQEYFSDARNSVTAPIACGEYIHMDALRTMRPIAIGNVTGFKESAASPVAALAAPVVLAAAAAAVPVLVAIAAVPAPIQPLAMEYAATSLAPTVVANTGAAISGAVVFPT
jgi:hypothetical protein